MATMAARIHAQLDEDGGAGDAAPMTDVLARAAAEMRGLEATLRGVEAAVAALSDAAPDVAARLSRLQDLDRSIQSAEAFAAYLDGLSAASGHLGAVDPAEALARVRLGALAAGLAGRAAPPSADAADDGFELL